MKYIDLRSDTVTQQTQAMRDAMLIAQVGDDVYEDDPTINELEKMAAKMFDKESALFVPSGTMGNQLAIMAQTRRGDEIIVGSHCHIVDHEVGATAVLSGVNLREIDFENAIPDAESIEKAIRSDDIHEPSTAMICLENALANGRVVPVEIMEKIYKMAKKHKIPVHLDGARLFNAVTALNVDVKEIVKNCDTLNCCLSKGLCAPVGSILVGDKEVIKRARKYRKMLGGGMRQAGFLAAAGIIALRDMTGRIVEDHINARYLAEKLAEIPDIEMDLDSVQTNMVFFKMNRAEKVQEALKGFMFKKGVKTSEPEAGFFRFVTNNDVSKEDVETVLGYMKDFMK